MLAKGYINDNYVVFNFLSLDRTLEKKIIKPLQEW